MELLLEKIPESELVVEEIAFGERMSKYGFIALKMDRANEREEVGHAPGNRYKEFWVFGDFRSGSGEPLRMRGNRVLTRGSDFRQEVPLEIEELSLFCHAAVSSLNFTAPVRTLIDFTSDTIQKRQEELEDLTVGLMGLALDLRTESVKT